jgi:quercetin dioxygenase-like cupin family protein
MNGVEYTKGDIVIIPPNQATDFEALEDTITTVVKYPGANNDKYAGDPA